MLNLLEMPDVAMNMILENLDYIDVLDTLDRESKSATSPIFIIYGSSRSESSSFLPHTNSTLSLPA
ncbi:hypothetical protein L5515_013307 [Caenorhabditis briggsae]|uniref:Uncharacterized protein n=1 Tax=Caenorhabditis briggsae TaxID=6238 RepID=A0AAE9J6T2_CAEBR|nr:hypothetical protein L5515_013307 [Caenorhabditis briggsae]